MPEPHQSAQGQPGDAALTLRPKSLEPEAPERVAPDEHNARVAPDEHEALAVYDTPDEHDELAMYDVHEEEHGEAAMGEAQKVSITASPRMRLFAIGINFLVIMELTIAMYCAAQNPDDYTPVFFKVFFSLLVPTLVVAFVGRRMIAKAER